MGVVVVVVVLGLVAVVFNNAIWALGPFNSGCEIEEGAEEDEEGWEEEEPPLMTAGAARCHSWRVLVMVLQGKGCGVTE
jgi:hypothetical protein